MAQKTEDRVRPGQRSFLWFAIQNPGKNGNSALLYTNWIPEASVCISSKPTNNSTIIQMQSLFHVDLCRSRPKPPPQHCCILSLAAPISFQTHSTCGGHHAFNFGKAGSHPPTAPFQFPTSKKTRMHRLSSPSILVMYEHAIDFHVKCLFRMNWTLCMESLSAHFNATFFPASESLICNQVCGD